MADTRRFTDRVREALRLGLPLPAISGGDGSGDDPPAPPPQGDPPAGDPPQGDPPAPPAPSSADDLPPDLGDASKKALRAEREARQAAERQAAEAQRQLEELRRAQESDAERAMREAREQGRSEALVEVNQRLVKAAVLSAATGKFADPTDAVALLNLSEFTVDDEGNVDATSVEAAIADMLEKKPHLKAGGTTPPKPTGNGDGGARGTSGQLTREDLKTMSPEEIEQARQDGRLDHLLRAGKT